MKTKLSLLTAAIFLAALGTGFGQPVITQQPQSCTNLAGTTASFTVEATGTEPLAYQWQKYSLHKPLAFSDLADRTNATLVLANVVSDDARDYRVVVTNIEGAVTSSVAKLYVILPVTLQFTASSYSVSEADGTVTLAVQRLNDATTAVSVDYATADGTATNGLKYTGTNGTLTFAAGETDKTLVVPILNNSLVEGTKDFQVILSNPTGGAVLGPLATATVLITDNDTGLQFEFGSYSVAEDAGFVLLAVLRGDDGDFPVSVDYATADGTATNGLKYTGTNGTLTFGAEETSKLIVVPILDEGLVEGTEYFQVILSNPTGGAVLGTPATASVCITDNDTVPHHFTGITLLPDKTAMLSLDGSVSNLFNLSGTISNQFMQMFDLYPVEASSNLLDWTRLALLLRTNNDPNPLLFQDTNAAGLNQCFYRTPTNHLLTAFPKPSGPFAVGTVDRVMIDPARTNLYRFSPATNAFMVTFWYPADSPPAGALPAPIWGQRLATDLALYEYIGNDSRWASLVPNLLGHRTVGVPLAMGVERFPVLIYSHGLRGWRKMISRRAEELASHGYVFVAIDHTDCWATEFPDDRYLAGSSSGDVPGRLKDMQFLLDELAVLNAGDPLFAGRLDLDRIGVTGGSYGGMVVETCRSDSRVKCAALWDATNVQLNGAGLQKPFLIALGESNSFYSEDQWLFSKATNNAVFLQIHGADHLTPSDLGWTIQIPWGRAPALANDTCQVWFFDTYLKGETPPFPTNPEIYNVQMK